MELTAEIAELGGALPNLARGGDTAADGLPNWALNVTGPPTGHPAETGGAGGAGGAGAI